MLGKSFSYRNLPAVSVQIRKQRTICYHRLTKVKFRDPISSRANAIWHIAASILLLSAFGSGQASSVSSYRDPVELVRKAVRNEIIASRDSSAHFMFRGVKTTSKGSTTKIYIETNEATAGLVVAYDGKPLTAEQRHTEQERLERFLKNPEELRKKRAQENEDSERTTRIVRALPDAFLYESAGEEMGSPGIGRVGDPLVKLKFRPNPKYEPPTRVEGVLTGMQGYILVDAVAARLASIDGALFKQVGFGWGILGHLNRGGRFTVHQQEIEDNLWQVSNMTLSFTGKILLLRNLSIQSSEVFSDFKREPSDLTFAQALELLKKEEAALAQNLPAGSLARER